MLTEIQHVRQIEGEGFRRWFTDSYFDLIVWYDDRRDCIGFQLCYDKLGCERSFTWRRGHGSQCDRIEGRETPGHSKATPVMASDDSFPSDQVAKRFLKESVQVDPDIARLVLDAIRRRPAPLQEMRGPRG